MQSNVTNDNSILSSNDASIGTELPTTAYAYVYSGIVIALFVIASVRAAAFFRTCANASQNLHDTMFRGLISTTMKFFDENPVGRITNRFTKDLGSVDEVLPRILFDALQINLNMFGAIIVTIFTDPKLSVVLLFMGVFFLVARKIFLKCSTNIKRLEGTSK